MVFRGETGHSGTWDIIGDTDQSWATSMYGEWDYGPVIGSYGINCWVCDAHESFNLWGKDKGKLWRSLDSMRQPYMVPLLLDCYWPGGGSPENTDPPPVTQEDWAMGMDREIQRFCMRRHSDGVNAVFCDGSAANVEVMDLWRQKWHRFSTPRQIDKQDWPSWITE